MIDKFVRSVGEAMAGMRDGSTVRVAGGARIGGRRALVDWLIERGAEDLRRFGRIGGVRDAIG
jgi:3-oxoadipate CoA-transferase alpha subunit